jgi:hypothetical protein
LMHDDNKAFTGHAWIYAPPFKIVDLSISLQPYSEHEQRYLQGYTLTETCDAATEPIGVFDLMEGELIDDHIRRYGRLPTMDDVEPSLHQFMKEYSPHRFVKDGLRFTYMPIKFSAPELPLETMRHPLLSGRLPIQVFEEFKNRK